MSDTPRTNEATVKLSVGLRKTGEYSLDTVVHASGSYAPVDFARQLERELAEARAELKRKDEALRELTDALYPMADGLALPPEVYAAYSLALVARGGKGQL